MKTFRENPHGPHQVRDHTVPGGGHDEEILFTNIDTAFKNLMLEAEGFDFEDEALPQQVAYAKWLKKQLVAGFPVVWMIMWNAQTYPIYKLTPPAGMYGHVEVPASLCRTQTPICTHTHAAIFTHPHTHTQHTYRSTHPFACTRTHAQTHTHTNTHVSHTHILRPVWGFA